VTLGARLHAPGAMAEGTARHAKGTRGTAGWPRHELAAPGRHGGVEDRDEEEGMGRGKKKEGSPR
jgi:hypothetical protein